MRVCTEDIWGGFFASCVRHLVLSFLLVVEMNICVGRDVGHNWQRGHV